jgi:hypothetical protein
MYWVNAQGRRALQSRGEEVGHPSGASVHGRRRFALALALFGFLANGVLFAYMELSDYTPLDGRWAPLVFVACPSNLIASFVFFDVNAHTPLMTFAWVFQAVVNTAIYFGLGVVAGRFLWKSS